MHGNSLVQSHSSLHMIVEFHSRRERAAPISLTRLRGCNPPQRCVWGTKCRHVGWVYNMPHKSLAKAHREMIIKTYCYWYNTSSCVFCVTARIEILKLKNWQRETMWM